MTTRKHERSDMATIQQICHWLESIAPTRLAEEWDNVGLLVGDQDRSAKSVMTCLTVTPETAEEAIRKSADLIVTHHPFPFRALKRVTVENTVGKLLWNLARHQVSIYSPHTAWDSAATGINQQLAEGFGLSDIVPLQPLTDDPDQLGSGRVGVLSDEETLLDFVGRVKRFLHVDRLQYVGEGNTIVKRVAVACGSAGSFLPHAVEAKCDLLFTGETTFHTCLEAEALGVALVLPGHFASERFSLDMLADRLSQDFPDINVWASDDEADPLIWH